MNTQEKVQILFAQAFTLLSIPGVPSWLPEAHCLHDILRLIDPEVCREAFELASAEVRTAEANIKHFKHSSQLNSPDNQERIDYWTQRLHKYQKLQTLLRYPAH